MRQKSYLDLPNFCLQTTQLLVKMWRPYCLHNTIVNNLSPHVNEKKLGPQLSPTPHFIYLMTNPESGKMGKIKPCEVCKFCIFKFIYAQKITTLTANTKTCKVCKGYIFHILQQHAAKLCNFNNFKMLVLGYGFRSCCQHKNIISIAVVNITKKVQL